MKFVLLHDGKNDDGIRAFFLDVWELYLKVGAVQDSLSTITDRPELQTLLNPFHLVNSPIVSAVFDARVKASAKKNL